jgi:hypothetical protein
MSLQVSKLKKEKRTTIMKKIYENPTTDIITISVSQMIAASNGLLGDNPENATFDLSGTVNETTKTSGNLSRRSVWDDTEDDVEY